MLLKSLLLLKGLKCSSVYMITCLIGKLNLIFVFCIDLNFVLIKVLEFSHISLYTNYSISLITREG